MISTGSYMMNRKTKSWSLELSLISSCWNRWTSSGWSWTM